MKKFLVNILCAFVPSRWKRHELRKRLITRDKFELLHEELAALAALIKTQSVHKDTFGPYKGIHSGKEVAIVATGPTLYDYSPIEGAIHIGVNAAFKWRKAKLDYLFLQDAVYIGMDRNNRTCGFSIDDVNRYEESGCVKFYGIAQRMLMKKTPTIRIPFADLIASGAKPYIMEDPERHSIAYDLSCEPMGTYSSVAFAALQFALYTNAKRIYLVGTDCGGTYFYKSNKKDMDFGTSFDMINDWKLFRDHIAMWYPEIEVVSVNPRGLRGLFKDMDTSPSAERKSQKMEI